MVSNGDSIIDNYLNDYKSYYNNFEIDDKVIENLRYCAELNGIIWDNDKFMMDNELIKVSIKSLIAGMVWTNNEKYRIINSKSTLLKKAVEIMPVAEKILDKRTD